MIIHVAQKIFSKYFQRSKSQKFENFWKIRNSQIFWKIQNFSRSNISLEGEGPVYPQLLPKKLQRQQLTSNNIDKYVRTSGTRTKTATKSSARKKLGETSETTKFSYACADVPDVCTYTFFLQIDFRDIFVSCRRILPHAVQILWSTSQLSEDFEISNYWYAISVIWVESQFSNNFQEVPNHR